MSKVEKIGKPIFQKMLRRVMSENGWTQEHVALVAGVSQASVNGWLAGSIPRADALYRLTLSCGMTTEELLTGERAAGDASTEVERWRDRALSAEDKLSIVKAGLSGMLKKI